MDLDSVVLEERVIKGWLVGDVHTVYDISIRALHYFKQLVLSFRNRDGQKVEHHQRFILLFKKRSYRKNKKQKFV